MAKKKNLSKYIIISLGIIILAFALLNTGILNKEKKVEVQPCNMNYCNECGGGYIDKNICDNLECISCYEELGCKFTPTTIGGKCESVYPECASCNSWLFSKLNLEKKCAPKRIDLIQKNWWNPVYWISSLFFTPGISQSSFCTVSILFTIVVIILIILILIQLNKFIKNKRRK